MLAALLSGCAQDERLEVFAAASLRDVLTELDHERVAGGAAPLRLNFGGSGELARQILAAGRADLFLSAGALELERLVEGELVLEGSRRVLASNRLVLIAPSGAVPSDPLAALSEVRRLSIANPAYVPAGRHARAWLEQRELWERLGPRASLATDVRAALSQVESGAAPLGIVYATDAARSDRVEVVQVISDGSPVRYPAGILRESPRQALAADLLDELAGPRGRALFARHGFEPPDQAEAR